MSEKLAPLGEDGLMALSRCSAGLPRGALTKHTARVRFARNAEGSPIPA
jgi:hypothetical protein